MDATALAAMISSLLPHLQRRRVPGGLGDMAALGPLIQDMANRQMTAVPYTGQYTGPPQVGTGGGTSIPYTGQYTGAPQLGTSGRHRNMLGLQDNLGSLLGNGWGTGGGGAGLEALGPAIQGLANQGGGGMGKGGGGGNWAGGKLWGPRKGGGTGFGFNLSGW